MGLALDGLTECFIETGPVHGATEHIMVREIAYLFLGLALLAQANHILPGGHGANQRQQDRHDGGNTGEAFFSIGSPLGLIYMDFDHAQYLSLKEHGQIDLTIDRWPT